MPKIPTRYGVPKLTLDEAARLLKMPRGQLIYWIADKIRPGQSRWSQLMNGKRELPEWWIRYYLMRQAELLLRPAPLSDAVEVESPPPELPSATQAREATRKTRGPRRRGQRTATG